MAEKMSRVLRTLEAGETILKQGDTGDTFYLVEASVIRFIQDHSMQGSSIPAPLVPHGLCRSCQHAPECSTNKQQGLSEHGRFAVGSSTLACL